MSASSIDQGESSGVSEAAMRRALARARDGKPLDQAEAAILLHARGDDLDRAARLRAPAPGTPGWRRAGRPGVITYSRKVFIPLTRLCRDRCGYCTFATVPGRLRQPVPVSPDEVLEIARRGRRARLQGSAVHPRRPARRTGGRRPASGWTRTATTTRSSYVRAMAIRVLEETGLLPHLNPGVHDLAGLPAAQAGRAVAWA